MRGGPARRRAAAQAAAMVCVLVVLACGDRASEAPAAAVRPNVFLVVLDTVRADRLSAYGHGRETSPRLDRLAAEGTLYEQAWSTSSWTSPAHASLFTGLFPVAHQTHQEHWTLAPALETLAEILKAEGYQTAGFVGNPMLSPERGFDQGFDQYFQAWIEAPKPPRMLNDRASAEAFARFLAGREKGRPFFAFVNLIGPHSPYDSCGLHCRRFVGDTRSKKTANQWHYFYLGRIRHTDEDYEHLRALYDAELLRADEWLGVMIDSLRDEGLLDDTIVVVTSDHGENIGDHGHVDHVFSLYESTTRVPLVVRYPKAFAAGARDALPAQLPDVFTTLLRLCGLEDRASEAQGLDLRDTAAREARPVLLEYARPVQALSGVIRFGTREERARLSRWDRALVAVVEGGRKLIEGSDGGRELYDLEADPEERTDLAAEPERADEVERLDRVLNGLRDRYARDALAPAEQAPLSDETRRALEAIGYVEE